jgi:hypothetical protein
MATSISTWDLLPNERISAAQSRASQRTAASVSMTSLAAVEGLYIHLLIQGEAATMHAAAPSAAASDSICVFKSGSVLMGPNPDESLAALRAIGPCLAFLADTSYSWLAPLTQAIPSPSLGTSTSSPSPWREYIAQSRCIIATLPLQRFFCIVQTALESVRTGLLRKMAASTLHVAAEIIRHKARDESIRREGGGDIMAMQNLIFGQGSSGGSASLSSSMSLLLDHSELLNLKKGDTVFELRKRAPAYVFFVVQGTVTSDVAILAALDCVEYAGSTMTAGLRKRVAEIKTVTVEKIGTLKVTYSGWECFGCVLECTDMNGDSAALRRRAVAQYSARMKQGARMKREWDYMAAAIALENAQNGGMDVEEEGARIVPFSELFVPHETVTVSSDTATLLAVKRSLLRRCFSQASLKLCRDARLDTLRSWMAAKLSDENLSYGETQTVHVQGDVWSTYQRSNAHYLNIPEPDAAQDGRANGKPDDRSALSTQSRPNTVLNVHSDESRVVIDEDDIERIQIVMNAAESLRSELGVGISKLQRRVADLRQVMLNLSEPSQKLSVDGVCFGNVFYFYALQAAI